MSLHDVVARLLAEQLEDDVVYAESIDDVLELASIACADLVDRGVIDAYEFESALQLADELAVALYERMN